MSATAIAMPRLGMTMEEGTIVEWPVPVGGPVEKGQIVLVIETEKAESEIEAVVGGFFRHAFVEPGETVPCGALLGAITDEADEAFDAEGFAASYVPPEGSVTESDEAAESVATPGPAAETPAAVQGGRRPVAPAARALARKLGVDLDRVDGSGPGGRVTKQDVEAFASARERLFQVEDGVGLEVLREGEGDPVVLLPGFGTDVSSFAFQSAALVDGYELVGVNPRGVAGSDAPDLERYEVARAAADVASVLAEAPPAHVVGASLGAAVALELALEHPDRVRSLVLVTPFVEASPRLLAFADAWVRLAAEAKPETLSAFLAPWLFGEDLLSDPARRERTLRGLAQAVRRIPAATLERSAAGLEQWSGSRTDALGRLRVPTLVLAAGEDLLTPGAEALAASIEGARVETLEGAGHALAIDAADDVTRLIRAHLAAS